MPNIAHKDDFLLPEDVKSEFKKEKSSGDTLSNDPSL